MGTTAEKLTYLNETKTKLKDMLNLGGASLTTEPFRQYVDTLKNRYLYFINNGTQEVWDNWEKVVGEGTTITLNNTEEAPMKIDLKGNTSQETTTGKNMIDIPTTTYTMNNYYYRDVGTGIQITSGMVGKSYSFSYDIDISSITTTVSGVSGVVGRGTTAGAMAYQIKVSTFPAEVGKYHVKVENFSISNEWVGQYIVVRFIGFAQPSTTTYTYSNVQFEQSTTATSYEPYTNGASPNPDYPQDIHVVTGDNSINVCGKNLFDKSKDIVEGYTFGNNNTYISASDFFYQSYYIPVKPNTTYSFLGQKTTGTDSLRVCEYKSDKEFIKRNYELYTITTTQDTRYIRVSNYKTKLDTTQVEISSISTTYEEYKGASYPINLGDIELCKIGDYQDKIDKSSGKNLFDGVFRQGNQNATGVALRIFSNKNDWLINNGDTFTFLTDLDTTTFDYNIYIAEKPFLTASNTMLWYSNYKTNASYTFTAGYTGYLGFTVRRKNETNISPSDIAQYHFMIQKGDIQNPTYEPYGTGWYLNKQIGKVVLDGTETFDGGSGTRWNYTPTLLPKLGSATSPNAISNYYTSKFSTDNNSIYVSGANQYISIMENRFSNVSGFKTWLASNNVTIYYVLNTPTYTEITDSTLISQLNALAKSYASQTNISQESNDLASILNATALEEMS